MSTEKHQILETITAISRLITLAFKPIGTKIAIRDHKVVLCDPINEKYYFNLKLTQSIDRYWNGDSRDDIYVLNHAISNFIEWYVISAKTKNEKLYKSLINMAKYLCVGLKRLQKTYKTGNVVCTLQYYINILTATIEDIYYSEMLYSPTSTSRKSFLEGISDEDINEDDGTIIYSTIFDIEKFRNFWTADELISLCSQFDACFRDPHEKEDNLFGIDIEDKDGTTVYASMNENENKIENEYENENENEYENENIIEKIGADKIVLPIPKSINIPIVMGHLVGVSKILDTMDKKFIGMLNQSVRGTK